MEEDEIELIKLLNQQRKEAVLAHLVEGEEKQISSTEIDPSFDTKIDQLVAGYKIGLETLTERGYLLAEVEALKKSSVSLDDCQINREVFSSLIEKKGVLKKNIEEKGSIQQFLGLSPNVLLAYYKAALELYDHKDFQNSEHVFNFLLVVNDRISDFWLGKGIACESLQKWEEAIDALWQALKLAPEVKDSYLYLIKIYHEIRDEDGLKKVLKEALNHPDLKEEVAAILEPNKKVEEV